MYVIIANGKHHFRTEPHQAIELARSFGAFKGNHGVAVPRATVMRLVGERLDIGPMTADDDDPEVAPIDAPAAAKTTRKSKR